MCAVISVEQALLHVRRDLTHASHCVRKAERLASVALERERDLSISRQARICFIGTSHSELVQMVASLGLNLVYRQRCATAYNFSFSHVELREDR